MSDMNNLIKGIGSRNKNLVNKDENHLNKETVLASYEFNFEVDEDTIDFLKEQTFKLHRASNNFYTELGKIFTETQDKLSKSGYGCFVEWYKSLGFKNDSVYRYISRYKLISSFAQSERQIVEKIESLPLGLSYEIAKETCPSEMREKVINGEIKNKVELSKAMKNVKNEEVEKPKKEEKDIVQEAEIVKEEFGEEKVSIEKIDIQLAILINELSRVEGIIKENNTKNNFEILLKIEELLNEIK